MSPLRILSVANVPMDINAGASGAELETILALRRLGHDVDDVWSDSVGRRIEHGNLHQLLELPRRYAAVVREHLERRPYDVVHVNQPHGFLAARMIRQSWPAVAFIHRSHGFEPRVEEVLAHWRSVYQVDSRSALRRTGTALLRSLLARHSREIVRWADGHILCSRQDADFMIERFHVDPARAGVLPQAAPDFFLEPALEMTRERLRTILYVGQFVFFKAPMVVAEAMNRIAAGSSEARFVWVAGPQHQDQIRALLDENVRRRLELLPWLPQPQLRDIYDRAGIFLFPSFFEGSGKVHIEALSRGLCVITTNLAGMRDNIESGRNGYLIEPGDPESLAARALMLLADFDTASRISAAAAEKARELSWHRTAVETAAFYEKILSMKTGRL